MTAGDVVAVLAAVASLLGFVFTLGMLKSRTDGLSQDMGGITETLAKLGAKVDGMNGNRLVRIESEIEHLRDWRHNVEGEAFTQMISEFRKKKLGD